MNPKLSARVEQIKPSATLALSAKANQLKAAGADIISLTAGESDFDTPEHIKQAAIEAMRQGQTRYTAVDGTAALKTAIVNKFKHQNNLAYTPDEIIVSCGGKQVFYNLAQAFLDVGDEALIVAPYWVSYPDMVILSGATPRIITTTIEQNFKLSADQLAAAINDKTKLLVINSPANPTGAIYTQAELLALAEVLRQAPQVFILSDDIYEHIIWHGSFANLAMVAADLKPRTIILNGVSKSYAMTGWRIGYGAGDASIIKAMKKIQSQSTSNPCSISQAAALAALNGEQSCIATMSQTFAERNQFVVERLNAINGVSCRPSDGAFYVFPNVSGLIDRLGFKNDVELSTFCLEKIGVAVVPGSAFGLDHHLRLSFATDLAELERALTKLADL